MTVKCINQNHKQIEAKFIIKEYLGNLFYCNYKSYFVISLPSYKIHAAVNFNLFFLTLPIFDTFYSIVSFLISFVRNARAHALARARRRPKIFPAFEAVEFFCFGLRICICTIYQFVSLGF